MNPPLRMRTLVLLVPLVLPLGGADQAPDRRPEMNTVAVTDTDGLRRALTEATPGTTIRIAPGTYRGGISARGLRGEPGRPIILEAGDPERPPVFEGGGTGLHLSDPSHVELRHLVVTKATGNGINIDDGGSFESPAHHVTLRGLTIRDIGPEGNRDGIKLSGLDDFHVEGCTVERWGSGGSGIDMVGCHRGVIAGCTFRHGDRVGSNGVQTKGGSREILVRACRFEHSGSRAVNVGGSTGLAYFRPAPQGYEARDITVEDCTFLGSEAAIAFVGVDGAEVRHNTIYRPHRYAFRILQETRAPGFVPCRNGKFLDNLVAFRSDEMTMPVNIGPETAPESFAMARNAWYCLDDPARSRPKLPIPEADGIYGQDPQFRDAEHGDLRLKPGSPLGQAGARAASASSSTPAGERPRLIVLTDISSLTSGVAEPDDGQSMVRLMFYANEFDVEGLIATSNLGHGQAVRPALIRQVVDAYGKVQPNLSKHDGRYPGASLLAATIKAGQPVAGPKVPVEESIGAGKDTEASDWIIKVVDRPDPRPVWVAIWGGSADLAQALWKVRQTRGPEALARFLSKLRVHAIADQDSTGPWIRENFPGLFVISNLRAMRGMYRGGDTDLSSSRWVEAHIKSHGALGDLYPDYNGGDIWSRTMGRVRGIKEGDTPSFLALIPNGLNVPERPWLGGWGGRFEGEANRYADVPDRDRDTSGDPDPRMVTVYRWRPAFQADFQARLDWSVKPYSGANHPPVVQLRGDRERAVNPGEEIVLDAGGSTDPDGDDLRFDWSLYPIPDEGEGSGEIGIEGRTSSVARLRVPPGSSGRTIPVLLTVRDEGSPALTRYGRVLVTVEEGK